VFAGVGRFAIIAQPAPRDTAIAVAEAVRAAASTDAIVVVGTTDEQETEAVDTTTLHLSGNQDQLVTKVAAAAKCTVLVVNAATPVIMPWADQVDAIIHIGLPGQEGGHALAAALLGDIEPAGRLVTTFPTDDNRSPAWNVTLIDGNLHYSEGTYIGYRGHHAGNAPTPAFWFGHGLSYSTFEYSDAELTGGGVTVTVTNTGDRDSREVVQVYHHPAEPDQPIRLAGWKPITLQAHQSESVTIKIDPRVRRRWDSTLGSWKPLAPGGTLLIARGLGDVRATFHLG
jgi:beta-glucosidase